MIPSAIRRRLAASPVGALLRSAFRGARPDDAPPPAAVEPSALPVVLPTLRR